MKTITKNTLETLKLNEKSLELKGKLYKQFRDTTYYVSNCGECIRLEPKPVFLKATKNLNGYYKFYMKINGKYEQNYVHRLVWQLFGGSLVNGEINHKNYDKSDNRLENLECVTHARNMEHYYDSIAGKVRLRKKPSMYRSIETVVVNLFTGSRTFCSNRAAASRSIGKSDVYITSLLSRGQSFDKENLFIEKNEYISKGYDLLSPSEIVKKMISEINFV